MVPPPPPLPARIRWFHGEFFLLLFFNGGPRPLLSPLVSSFARAAADIAVDVVQL